MSSRIIWPPEVDAILSEAGYRPSHVDLLERVRLFMPDVTQGAMKRRRMVLMQERGGGTGRLDRSVYTPERDAYLAAVWPSSMPFNEIRAGWAKLGPETRDDRSIRDHAARLGLKRGKAPGKEPEPPQSVPAKAEAVYAGVEDKEVARMIRAASDRFGAVAVKMDDIPDPEADPTVVGPARHVRRGIMVGPPPDLDQVVTARARQARQARTAVGEAFVRGLT